MPWMETEPMDQRKKFVESYRSRTWTMTELCERFSVSRKTGYKWLRTSGARRLGRAERPEPEASQLPVANTGRGPSRPSSRRRVAHPDWGPGKILEYLRASGSPS